MDAQKDYQTLKVKLSDQRWRLNNLYHIKDKDGNRRLMRLNWAQNTLYNNLWYFNIILKARQLGFSTFSLIYFLDCCLFNSDHAAGVVAHTRDDAEDLFTNKVRFAYENLPEWLKKERAAKTDTAKKLVLSNGSSISVGTSLRSGTYQKLLISEYGKVSAKYPEKAREIKTGALNTVQTGQQVFVESTAEGQGGEFYDMCQHARRLADESRPLSMAEPRFHFFPWWRNPEYALPPEETALVPVSPAITARFAEQGLVINSHQAAWYAAKMATMGEDIFREFPSTPDEAFQSSLHAAWYAQEMKEVRSSGRLLDLVPDRAHGVYTFWDLGTNDLMTCWFGQYIGGRLYMIDYFEDNNEGWGYYAKLLQDRGYVYLRHFFPHDGETRRRGVEITTDKQTAENVGIRPIHIVPRTKSVSVDIRNVCRPAFPLVSFDRTRCAVGVNHLDNYKRVWDRTNGMYTDDAVHDEASHGADSFRTALVALRTGLLNTSHNGAPLRVKTQGLNTTARFTGAPRLRSTF